LTRLTETLRSLLVPAPVPYSGSITLAEHQSLTCELPSTNAFAPIAALFAKASAKGLVTVQSRVAVDGRTYLHLRSGSKVGFVALAAEGELIFVRVRPKIEAVRMLDLAHAAGMLPDWRRGDTSVAADATTAVMDWTLQAFASEAGRLMSSGGIRPAHVRVRENLQGRLRGKLLIRPYMANVVRGMHQNIPCEFQSLQIDNPHNRLLLRAISTARALCRLRPEGPLLSLETTFAVLERRLEGGVSTANGTEALLRAARTLPVNMRHYAKAKQLAEIILGKVWMGAEAGPNTAASLILDMNDIYQRAFAKLFSMQVPEVQPQVQWPLRFHRLDASRELAHQTTIRPDLWIPPISARAPIVIDTKWKDAFGADTPERQLLALGDRSLVKVSTTDAYQVTAYALKALSLQPAATIRCVASLVYPSLGLIPDSGFRVEVNGTRIDVLLQAWDLSRPLEDSVADLWNRLRIAATEPAPSPVSPPDSAGVSGPLVTQSPPAQLPAPRIPTPSDTAVTPADSR
jgi:5-methylcytosine-specific restriction endonuclease McrBC regulatory subunit McrC